MPAAPASPPAATSRFPKAAVPSAAGIIFTVGLLLAVAFLGAVGGALTVFLIGLILAFLLDPIVTWLAARRVPRGLATLLTMAVFFIVLGLLVVAFLDVVVTQARCVRGVAAPGVREHRGVGREPQPQRQGGAGPALVHRLDGAVHRDLRHHGADRAPVRLRDRLPGGVLHDHHAAVLHVLRARRPAGDRAVRLQRAAVAVGRRRAHGHPDLARQLRHLRPRRGHRGGPPRGHGVHREHGPERAGRPRVRRGRR